MSLDKNNLKPKNINIIDTSNFQLISKQVTFEINEAKGSAFALTNSPLNTNRVEGGDSSPLYFSGTPKLERLANRIEECKLGEWKSLVCLNCGHKIKGNVVRVSCMSPFCQDKECQKNRINLNLSYLNSLNLRSKNYIHLIFGFEHIPRYTKSIKKKQLNCLRRFIYHMKKLGFPLRLVRVRDISGSKKDLFVHYHCLQLPVKDLRLFTRKLIKAREIVLKHSEIPFTVRCKGYRSKGSLFRYLSHRMSGIFGDLKNKSNSYGYPDLMDLTTYYKDFYGSNAVCLIGLRKPEGLTNVPYMIESLPQICPKCQSNHIRVVPNSMLPIKPLVVIT